LFVCQHDNFQTIKRRMMKLGGFVHSTKNVARVRMSTSKVKGQGHRGHKNEKVRQFVLESSSGAQSSCGIFPERSSGARSSTPVGKSAHAV